MYIPKQSEEKLFHLGQYLLLLKTGKFYDINKQVRKIKAVQSIAQRKEGIIRIEKADFETAKHVIDKSRRDKAIVFHTSHFRDFVSHLETRRNESYQTEGLE